MNRSLTHETIFEKKNGEWGLKVFCAEICGKKIYTSFHIFNYLMKRCNFSANYKIKTNKYLSYLSVNRTPD